MVGTGGLEPPTSCMSSRRSNQLSYMPVRALRAANALPRTAKYNKEARRGRLETALQLLDGLVQAGIAGRGGIAEGHERGLDEGFRPQALAVQRLAVGLEIPCIGHPQAVAFGQ